MKTEAPYLSQWWEHKCPWCGERWKSKFFKLYERCRFCGKYVVSRSEKRLKAQVDDGELSEVV